MAKDSLEKASQHEPVGTPGGPGLWKHKTWQLPAYIQHIANDLREKRGMPESRAIATAIAAVKRWAAGGGNVDKNTRAAASKAVAEWEGLKARAAGSRAGKAALSELEDPIVTPIEFSDEDFQNYSVQNLQGGFSPGTANVSAEDYQKLLPMLRFYAKKPHPFRACYEDVKEEFGDNAERYAALIKDLIYHSTAWRNAKAEEGMTPVVLAEFADWEEDDYLALAELVGTLDEDKINDIILAHSEEEEGLDLASTNIGILQKLADDALEYLKVEKDHSDRYEMRDIFRRVHSLIAKDRADSALEKAPHPLDAAGASAHMSEGDPWMAEMFFAAPDDTIDAKDEDGVIWKTIMREGRWKLSPGPGQRPVAKPITVIAKGKSDPAKLVISMSELLKNFKDGAVEHVTIPTSHDNKVVENTGFIRDLRMKKDENGRSVLQAAHDFTEPEVKGKAARGSIANTSAGVLFDYPRKEDGKTYRAVLEHVALTNRPWLSGMKPFGMAATNKEVKTVMTFSEEVELSDEELEALMSEVPGEETEPEDKGGAAADREADVELSEADKATALDLAATPISKCNSGGKSGYQGHDGVCYVHDGTPAGKKAALVKAFKTHGVKASEEQITDEMLLSVDGGLELTDVEYADPGYQEDGVKRYPLDSERHCRAAWAYLSKAHNAENYTSGQLKKVRGRVRVALKKYGANVNMSDERLTRENLSVLLSQEVSSQTASEGGAEMPEEKDYVERFGLSEEEIEEALKERETLKASQKEARVTAKLSEWTEAKKSPAVLEVAEAIMMSDDGTIAVEIPEEGASDRFNLSEGRKKKTGLTLSDVVERLVEASPTVNLEDKKVTDKATTEGTRPEEETKGEEIELSADVAAEARRLFLYEGKSEEEAIALAQAAADKKSE